MLATRKFFCLLPQPTDNGQTTERASFMCSKQTTDNRQRTTTNGLLNFLIYFQVALYGGSV